MALFLLAQMPTVRVTRDVISFNAGISACEKGGEWQRAFFLLAHMPSGRVIPTEISLSAGISACSTARQWCIALSLLSCIVSNGRQTPNTESYAQILDAVCTEKLSFKLFRKALEDQAWPNMLCNGGTQLDLHFHSSGSAMLAVLWWLAEIVPGKVAAGKSLTTFEIITGWGKSRESRQTSDVRASVPNLLDRCGIRCKVHPRNQGSVQVDLQGWDVTRLPAFFPKWEMADAESCEPKPKP